MLLVRQNAQSKSETHVHTVSLRRNLEKTGIMPCIRMRIRILKLWRLLLKRRKQYFQQKLNNRFDCSLFFGCLTSHFGKHGNEFDGLYSTAKEYAEGAKYVTKNGTYIPEMNGYIKFFGSGGKANYAFVGLTRNGLRVTAYEIRGIADLARKIPWLII